MSEREYDTPGGCHCSVPAICAGAEWKRRATDAERLLKQTAIELEEAGKLLRHAGMPGVASIMDDAACRNRAFLAKATP